MTTDPVDLTAIVARVRAALMDDGTIFSDAVVTEAVRAALDEYSEAAPAAVETVITLPGAGREIALDALTGLVSVTRVWWPYRTADGEAWPPNAVTGFTLWWDDARPVLFLDALEGAIPAAGDELRLWYARAHTVQGVSEASVTTVPAAELSLLVLGATGFALLARSYDQTEIAATGAISTPNYAAAGFRLLRQFRLALNSRRHDAARPAGPPWGEGWDRAGAGREA